MPFTCRLLSTPVMVNVVGDIVTIDAPVMVQNVSRRRPSGSEGEIWQSETSSDVRCKSSVL